jgi:hypothetical protein
LPFQRSPLPSLLEESLGSLLVQFSFNREQLKLTLKFLFW